MPSSSPRRPPLFAYVAVVAIAVAAYLFADRAPAPAPAPEDPPAAARPQVEQRTPAPPPVPVPSTTSTPVAPGSLAPPVAAPPGAPVMPPTATEPRTKDLEIPPEEPQTPEWRLQKTTLISRSLVKRIQRLEEAVREAEAKGDRETAQMERVLLERSRKRMAELEQEIASLREQVRADGGSL